MTMAVTLTHQMYARVVIESASQIWLGHGGLLLHTKSKFFVGIERIEFMEHLV